MGYAKTALPSNAAAHASPDSEYSHAFGALRLTIMHQQSPKNAVDRIGTAGAGSDPASREGSRVLAILRAAYGSACGERKRIQTDLDLLVSIARAVEADIYDPAFALERAIEHGLLAWLDVEVVP